MTPTPIPEDFMIAKGKAAEEYKERCKVDRDRGHLADCDFSEGAEWAYRHLLASRQTMRWVKGDELPVESDHYISEVISNVDGVQTVQVKYLQYIKGFDHFIGLREHERVVRWLLDESPAPTT